MKDISLHLIDPNPFQPRLAEDPVAIAALADNISRNGLLQIPSARVVDGRYQLAFGHTRKAAFDLLYKDGRIQPLMPLNIVELTDLQMFEAAVSENIQRRDLNPVEVAQAMKRYMLDFGKTSKECGEFFGGMSDATVRGKVRLLDLPDAAQKQLAEGKITEGAARALLTLAKLADEKAIKEALKDIEQNNGDTPEEIVENIIDRLDGVKEMWANHRDGKPRGGYGLWLLDMKNFPNKALEPLSRADLNAIGIDDTSANMTLATRYLNGEDAYLPEALKTKIDHLTNPPACTACPYYTVINKSHYCGLRICHERKAQAFKTQQLADMSRSLKIEPYLPSDGGYVALDHHKATNVKAFDDRHADLRLLPHDSLRGYTWQNFKGVNTEIAYVVAVGPLAEKFESVGSKTHGGKKTEKEKAEMRAMRLYRQVRLELVWEYTAAAQSIFAGLPMSALEKLESWKFVGIDDRIPDEHRHPNTGSAAEKLEYARRKLTWALIVGATSHYSRDELVDYLTTFHELTGVKAPKALLKRAQDWDAEIAALAKPAVSAETKGKKK